MFTRRCAPPTRGGSMTSKCFAAPLAKALNLQLRSKTVVGHPMCASVGAPPPPPALQQGTFDSVDSVCSATLPTPPPSFGQMQHCSASSSLMSPNARNLFGSNEVKEMASAVNIFPESKDTLFMKIVSRQQFDGSWSIEDVAELLGLGPHELHDLNLKVCTFQQHLNGYYGNYNS